jgi:hypothetical protein
MDAASVVVHIILLINTIDMLFGILSAHPGTGDG